MLEGRLGVPVPLDDDALGLVLVEVGVELQRSGVLGPHDLHRPSGQALVLVELAFVELESSDTRAQPWGPPILARSVVGRVCARRTGQDARNVLEQLDATIERPAGDHLERDIRVPVVDPVATGASRDDREHDHAEAVHEAGSSKERHRVRLPIVRIELASSSSFSSRTT